MSRKRLFVDGREWGIHEQDVAETVAKVREAMAAGVVVELPVRDGADRRVTMLFNGKVATTVVFDLDMGPRPTEISG